MIRQPGFNLLGQRRSSSGFGEIQRYFDGGSGFSLPASCEFLRLDERRKGGPNRSGTAGQDLIVP